MQVRDDFESITESAPLVEELRKRIAARGAITFREFMKAALYHPRYGYYSTNEGTMSRGGDYVTSPEVHAVFGVLVARQLYKLWQRMSRPPRFDVVEQGAGRGLLARDALDWARRHEPAFARAMRYGIVEVSPRLRAAQRQVLDDAGITDRVVWDEELPRDIEGCVLSNELIDAFPVHRVVRQGGELCEVYVTNTAGRFADELRPPSTGALASYFERLGLLPGDGAHAEVNLDAVDWMTNVGGSLRRGYVLTFDYGYEAADLYAPWRRDGTLLCFHRQSASTDPYQRIGKQDITASVDFTTLRRTGEVAGLTTIAMTDQTTFLMKMGLSDGIATIARERPDEMEEYFARRRVVMDLIDPARLGRIKVLLQGKDVPLEAPRAFASDA